MDAVRRPQVLTAGQAFAPAGSLGSLGARVRGRRQRFVR